MYDPYVSHEMSIRDLLTHRSGMGLVEGDLLFWPHSTYTRDDIRREYLTEKGCAPHCTVSCVHQVSIFDSWRGRQHPVQPPTGAAPELVQIQ